MSSLPPPEMPKYSGNGFNELSPKRESRALVALVCALLGLILLPIVFGGTAIVLGVQARKKIQASQGMLTGEGLSKAAVILGALDVAFYAFLLATR
jgi:predicted permease